MKSLSKDLFLLTLFLALLFSALIGNAPLSNPDEGRYSEVAHEMIKAGEYITPHVNGVAFLDKPPLMYWIEVANIHLFGLNAGALRAGSALLALLTCLFLYYTARTLYNRRAGWFAALGLATSFLYFALAHYVNMDMGITAFISSTLFAFLLGSQAPPHSKSRRNWFYTAYILAALGILTKGLIALAFPIMIIGLWVLIMNRWSLLKTLRIPSGLLIVLLLSAPWFILVQRANPEFLHYFFIFQQVTRFTGTQFNNPAPWWFYLPIILFGAFPWTFFFIAAITQNIKQFWSKRKEYECEWFLMIWIASITLFFSIPNSKIISYILPIFPAIALLTAGQFAKLEQPFTHLKNWLIAHQIFLLLIAAMFFSLAFLLPSLDLHLSITHVKIALISMTIILVPGSLLATWQMKHHFIRGLIILLCTTTLILWVALWGEFYIQVGEPTTKVLVEKVKSQLTPKTTIVNYYDYFQDLPVYIGKYITVIANWDNPALKYEDNSIGQMAFAAQYKPTSKQWLLTDERFWPRWHSNEKMIAFVNEDHLVKFKRLAEGNYHPLAQHFSIWVISNRKFK